MILKFIYTFFLALLVALFVGLGIDTFYPGPEMPIYPTELDSVKPGCEETQNEKTVREQFNQAQNQYQKDIKPYNRKVSIASLIAAIIILVASLTLLKKIQMMADGILLGGVFTTAYSIIRGLMSEDSRFRFIMVTVGLVIALALGYIKFIKPKVAEDKNQ
jgi:VIT1/CCC1 family predicted Fe2+/Mn2+ transporter